LSQDHVVGGNWLAGGAIVENHMHDLAGREPRLQ
jgi:hypothetical protein